MDTSEVDIVKRLIRETVARANVVISENDAKNVEGIAVTLVAELADSEFAVSSAKAIKFDIVVTASNITLIVLGIDKISMRTLKHLETNSSISDVVIDNRHTAAAKSARIQVFIDMHGTRKQTRTAWIPDCTLFPNEELQGVNVTEESKIDALAITATMLNMDADSWDPIINSSTALRRATYLLEFDRVSTMKLSYYNYILSLLGEHLLNAVIGVSMIDGIYFLKVCFHCKMRASQQPTVAAHDSHLHRIHKQPQKNAGRRFFTNFINMLSK